MIDWDVGRGKADWAAHIEYRFDQFERKPVRGAGPHFGKSCKRKEMLSPRWK